MQPGMGAGARRQSPLEYDFKGGAVLLSSEQAGWNGLAARYYRAPANYHDSMPPLALDALAIQIADATPLTSTIMGVRRQVYSVPGDIYLLPKGEASAWYAREACDLLHIYATPGLLGSVALQSADLDPARVELLPRVQARDPLIHQIGLALLGELRSPGPASRLYVDTLTQTLALHLLRQHAALGRLAADPAGGLPAAALRRALDYIGDNLANDVSLDIIAEVAGISPYHFTRLFKRSTGRTLHQYVLDQRLAAAKRLLLSGRHTIAEVAALAGFADQSHLHRLFKQRYGVTPGALLRRPENRQEASDD